MIYNEIDFKDELRIVEYCKKWRLFSFISRLFCLHFYKRNGILGSYDIWTCCKCGKNYYQDVTFNLPPVNYIKSEEIFKQNDRLNLT